MTIIYFGKTIRHASMEQGGELVKLDWTKKKVQNRVPIFPQNPSLHGLKNPRRTGQGCRGVEIINGNIIASDYHTLRVFDRDLQLIKDIRHTLLSDIHEIYHIGDNRLLVASTNIDAVLDLDIDNNVVVNEYWPRENETFKHHLKLNSISIDKSEDQRTRYLSGNPGHDRSHLHLNAVTQWNEEVYVLFNSFGVVANLSRNEIVIKDDNLIGGHNLVINEDGIVMVNDTRGAKIRFYDIKKKKGIRVIDLKKYRWIRKLHNYARLQALTNYPRKVYRKIFNSFVSIANPLFVRGLDCSRELIYVGFSPASIVCINWENGNFEGGFCYSKNIRNCIHGLRVDESNR